MSDIDRSIQKLLQRGRGTAAQFAKLANVSVTQARASLDRLCDAGKASSRVQPRTGAITFHSTRIAVRRANPKGSVAVC